MEERLRGVDEMEVCGDEGLRERGGGVGIDVRRGEGAMVEDMVDKG